MNTRSPESSVPADDPREFHLKEWEFLRADIRSQVEQAKYLEFATIAGLAAFYAWFASSTKQLHQLVLWLPVALVFLGGLRSYGTLKHIQRQAKYVRRLEEYLSANAGPLIGWDRTRDKLQAKSAELKVSAALFWAAALAVTLAALAFL
jgi:hypothetical protein